MILCLDAKVQPLGSYCETTQQCLTEEVTFSSVPCLNDMGNVECSEEKFSYEVCRGVATCSNPTIEQKYCSSSHQCPYIQDTYKCDQVHAVNMHNECRQRSKGGSSSQFDCLNRSDEATQLFKRTVFQAEQRALSPILNMVLDFDQERLYCRENVSFRWNSADLTQLNSRQGNIKYCTLTNGEAISDFQLYQLLMKDQSFIGRKYFQEGWLEDQ